MLSVLIVNWKTRDLLEKCLASLAKYPPKIPIEIIVVDNDSGDGSAEMVQTQFPGVILILSGGNIGYAMGNNLAFSVARGEWLLTLNPDTEFSDDSLQRALEILAKNPAWGALGIRLIGPDGETQKSVRGFPSIAGVFGEVLGLDRWWPSSVFGSYSRRDFPYDKSGEAPQPMGSFLLFRRVALAAVGDPAFPFDPQFPIFYNEVDLLYRMREAGWPAGYTPDASVLHHHGSGTRQVRPSMIWESHLSLVRYFTKHLRGPARWLLPLIGLASRLAACVRARGVHAGFRPDPHHLQLEHADGPPRVPPEPA